MDFCCFYKNSILFFVSYAIKKSSFSIHNFSYSLNIVIVSFIELMFSSIFWSKLKFYFWSSGTVDYVMIRDLTLPPYEFLLRFNDKCDISTIRYFVNKICWLLMFFYIFVKTDLYKRNLILRWFNSK